MKKYRIYSENSQEYREYEKKVKDSKTTYEYDALLTFQEFINKVCGSTGKVISLETDSEWINCKSFEKKFRWIKFILVIEYDVEEKDI